MIRTDVPTEKVNSDCSMENGLGEAGLEAGRLVVSLVTIIVILTKILTVWMKRRGRVGRICTEFISSASICSAAIRQTLSGIRW